MIPLKRVFAIDLPGKAFDDPAAIRTTHGSAELVVLDNRITDVVLTLAADHKLLQLMQT